MVNQENLHSNISSLRGGICLYGLEFSTQWAFSMCSRVFISWLPWHINTQFNTPISLVDMNKGATGSLFPMVFYERQHHKGSIFK